MWELNKTETLWCCKMIQNDMSSVYVDRTTYCCTNLLARDHVPFFWNPFDCNPGPQGRHCRWSQMLTCSKMQTYSFGSLASHISSCLLRSTTGPGNERPGYCNTFVLVVCHMGGIKPGLRCWRTNMPIYGTLICHFKLKTIWTPLGKCHIQPEHGIPTYRGRHVSLNSWHFFFANSWFP